MDSAERDEKKKSRSMNFLMGIADTVDKFSDENMILSVSSNFNN